MQEWLQRTIETFQFIDDEKPYVNIREIATKIGLDWPEEQANLRANDHWEYREEMIEENGEKVLCAGIPASKVFVWLKSVDVTRVLPALQRPLFEYQEQARQITRDSFLQSDLLAYARAKTERSPLEQKLVEAADLLERQKQDEKNETGPVP